MNMMKRLLSILFKLMLVIGCLTGMYLTVRRTRNVLQSFSYYTLQSNAVCLLLFIWLLGRDIRALAREWSARRTMERSARRTTENTILPAGMNRFKGACTLYILITFLVYHFLLSPQLGTSAPGYQVFSLSDVLVHYFTPLMVLADYLLFDRKGRFRAGDPFFWSLLPLSYLPYVFIYTSLGGRFGSAAKPSKAPYFFLDIDRFGLGGVALWVLAIVVLFLILAYGLMLFDRWLGRRSAHPSTGTSARPPDGQAHPPVRASRRQPDDNER